MPGPVDAIVVLAPPASGATGLRATLDALQVGILLVEAPSGRVLETNPFLDRLRGTPWPRSAGIEDYRDWNCFLPDGTPLAPRETPLARALSGEERPVLEVLQEGADGERRWLRITGTAIRDANGAITAAVATVEDIDAMRRAEAALRDNTLHLLNEAAEAALRLQNSQRALSGVEAERVLAEEKVRQLQKMEAVGQLTGGIAHDFNNMLAVVVGALGLMQRRLNQGSTDIGRFVAAAMDGAQRAASLTQRLLLLSRQQALAAVPLDATALVRGMEELLRRTLGEAIELEMVLSDRLWRIHADPSQIENALLNLAVNARDAMNGVGRLLIQTENVPDGEAANGVGCFVRLAVTDTGCGMSPEVASRAAEPFFTTKRPGEGTGLGLSQVQGAVRQCSGHLDILSEPGRGTTVRLFLPRFADRPGPAQPRRDQAAPQPQLQPRPQPGPATPRRTAATQGPAVPPGRAREVVLVVEDDRRVRALAVLGLRELGYGVLEASGAEPALRQLDAHPEVALLFTDIVMPGMDGRALAAEATRLHPGLRVLFTTGDGRGIADGADSANASPSGAPPVIVKPYGIERLSASVRAVLDR